MNKQINKIDEFINWLEQNAPDDACIIFLAMFENPAVEQKTDERALEVKTYVDGYDAEISKMLVRKMHDIPLLVQVFNEALFQVGVKLDYDNFLKWREKNKYDNQFDPFDLETSGSDEEVSENAEPEEYIKKVQEFSVWMNEKPSRNMTLLLLAQDQLNSPKTTFAMGFAPDISNLVANELKENYGLRSILESAMFAMEHKASFEEFQTWKDSLKK